MAHTFTVGFDMAKSEFKLLTVRRFLPLFVTQFLGALNDNLFKNALVILILFRLAEAAGMNGQILVTVAAGIFILPFFLFSATAGQVADRVEKSRLIRIIKLCEIGVMAAGAVGLFWGNATFLLVVLFLMGTQSAFFGPVKFGILPAHLKEDELIAGNGLIGAATFLAILIGTIAGGLLILGEGGIHTVAGATLAIALLGYAASRFIPDAPAPSPDLAVNPNILAETWTMIRRLGENRSIFLSVLGISWFWLVGAMFLAEFPAYAKDVLGANEQVVTLFLTIFSIGIGIGALLCNKLLDGDISAKFVPLGALGMTVFTLDLYWASPETAATATTLIGAAAFLETPGSWRIVLDLLGVAVTAGLYIVPLYAILQSRSDEANRSRIIAGNNIVNALFMVAGAGLATAMLAASFTVTEVFLVVAILNGGVAIYICKLLPDALVKMLFASVLRLLYRVEVRGKEHYEAAGERAVIVVNHVSFLDGILLGAFLPKKPTFAVDTFIAKQWWVKPFLKLVDVFTVDPTNPLATKSLIKVVQDDRQVVIFPEGRITVTGALMKVYEGPGLIADKAGAPILPVRIDGAQYSPFSRLKGKLRLRWFPKITITILPPQRFEIAEEVKGRARRQMAGVKLYDVMSSLIFETCDLDRSLFEALLEAKTIHGASAPIVEDIERIPLSYGRLVMASQILGRRIARVAKPREVVGLLLPNSVGAIVTFFGLQAFGRVPAMLNFSTGYDTMASATRTAEIKQVLTSRRFVRMANLREVVDRLAQDVEVVYLEDVKKQIGVFDKLLGVLLRLFAGVRHRRLGIRPDDPAVVLFTSGSEGAPKGVMLSHRNLLANRYQLAARIDFNPTDVVFNALPVFHSFGLTGGTLLPVLSGIKTFMYPSPLHYRIIPALAYDTNATILFGTDTFLSGYARVAHPYDFYSVRYIFAGAEKVKDETRRVWHDKFGIRILEGYGATETAPVLAVNTAMHFNAGTVGRFLPGIEHRLEPVPGVDNGARLAVSGPNVMLGYLKADAPGKLQPLDDRWYDTGDIVHVDEHGYVTIRGRAKRFAKIAGEMVSLSAVEGHAAAIWPDHLHAAVSLPDPRKGEQVILFTEHPEADRAALLDFAKQKGVAEIMIPKSVVMVDKLPILGTGKVDYVGVSALAEETL